MSKIGEKTLRRSQTGPRDTDNNGSDLIPSPCSHDQHNGYYHTQHPQLFLTVLSSLNRYKRHHPLSALHLPSQARLRSPQTRPEQPSGEVVQTEPPIPHPSSRIHPPC